MLLRIGIANHLSLRDSQELSLVASKLKDPNEGLIECKSAPNGTVLPAVVVYGANASGKSNLVDAVQAMRTLVLESHAKGEPGGEVPRQPFRLDTASLTAPSRFELDFVIERVRHHYGFEANDKEFLTEWLYAFPRTQRRTLYFRQGGEFSFGRALRGPNATIARLTRPNSLFLSAAAQNYHPLLSSVFSYFRSIASIRDVAFSGSDASRQLGDEEPDRRVIAFLGQIDTGVIGYRLRETERSRNSGVLSRTVLTVPHHWLGDHKNTESYAPPKDFAIDLAHRSKGGAKVFLELERESAGTRRLLVLLSCAFRALDQGSPLLIDELDTSLHTHACEAFLHLFCSRETNPKGAQVIATTHDASLMGSRIMRRDQLWFTRKGGDGATELYPLTDFRTRRGDNLETGYRQGRYGAVPFEDPLSTLG